MYAAAASASRTSAASHTDEGKDIEGLDGTGWSKDQIALNRSPGDLRRIGDTA